MSTFISFLLILISPAIGSFLAVLADRLARGEDVLTARSRCRACSRPLRPVELIPVLSFLRLRGRCARCGAPIPPWTLYIEILAFGAAVLAVLAGGGTGEILLAALFLWLLIALGASDLIWMRLPDPLSLALFLTALAMAPLPGGPGLGPALWGAVLGVGSFAALRWGYGALRGRAGLGLGDVKLMAGLGGFSGPHDLPYLVLLAAVSALAAAFLTRHKTAEGMGGARALPFGAALCAAAALLWFIRAATR